jgi:hypothetical protein
MSMLCGQRSCFDKAQTAWPSDAQHITRTEGHRSWRVSVCVYTAERDDSTSPFLEPLTSRNLTRHFVWTGNWRLVSFLFVIFVLQVLWWLWWCWQFVVVSAAQCYVNVLTEQPSGQLLKQYQYKQTSNKKKSKTMAKEKRKCNAAAPFRLIHIYLAVPMPCPCYSPGMPCRWEFRLFLSYLIYTVRPCLIHTCHAAPVLRHDHAVLKATSEGHGTARHGHGMGMTWLVWISIGRS